MLGSKIDRRGRLVGAYTLMSVLETLVWRNVKRFFVRGLIELDMIGVPIAVGFRSGWLVLN